jgi:hypothetical protein
MDKKHCDVVLTIEANDKQCFEKRCKEVGSSTCEMLERCEIRGCSMPEAPRPMQKRCGTQLHSDKEYSRTSEQFPMIARTRTRNTRHSICSPALYSNSGRVYTLVIDVLPYLSRIAVHMCA